MQISGRRRDPFVSVVFWSVILLLISLWGSFPIAAPLSSSVFCSELRTDSASHLRWSMHLTKLILIRIEGKTFTSSSIKSRVRLRSSTAANLPWLIQEPSKTNLCVFYENISIFASEIPSIIYAQHWRWSKCLVQKRERESPGRFHQT